MSISSKALRKVIYIPATPKICRQNYSDIEGRVRSTRNRRPLELVYFETFSDRGAAMKREYFLKSPEGGAKKKEIIANFDKKKLKQFPIK